MRRLRKTKYLLTYMQLEKKHQENAKLVTGFVWGSAYNPPHTGPISN